MLIRASAPSQPPGTMARSMVAAVVACLILAATETVAAYPRPSSASWNFFTAAFTTYLPFLALGAALLAAAVPRRGISLWFPVTVGALRVVDGVGPDLASTLWILVLLGVLLPGFLAIRWAADRTGGSPPFLFGATVGIVLPVLAGRVAVVAFGVRLGGASRALALGALIGLAVFVALRGLVSIWPKTALVFLLGPAVGLGLWSQGAPSTPSPRAVQAVSSTPRPDVVLIVLDTVRAQALASYGRRRTTMPGLEAFARRATTFEKAWTNASWTLPAHASLFSGLRLTRNKYDSGYAPSERVSSERFLASRLRAAGYATGAVSANFGVFGREDPLLAGFDRVDVEPLRPFVFRPWLFDLLAWFPRAMWLEAKRERFPGPSMRAPWVVDRSLEFWAKAAGRPRFLFVNFMEAHLPWIPERQDLGRFAPVALDIETEQISVLGRYLQGGRPTPAETEILRARYDESLYSLDRSLTRLLEAVTAGGSNEGAIVVVTSDHGESLGEHDRFGHRNSLDEEATRIPLFVRGPGLESGARLEAPVELVDVFGYLARAAGLHIEGALDCRPLGERRQVVIEHRPGPQGRLPTSYPRGDLSALIEWPFKYVEGPEVAPALFDLSADPGEQRNLVLIEPARVKAMSVVLHDLSGSGSSQSSAPDRISEERLRALGYVR